MNTKPFKPVFSAAVGLTITSSTARVALPAGYDNFRLHNRGTADVHLVTGDNTITATATNTGHMTLGAGAIEVLTIPSPANGTLYIAGIGTDGSVNITPGHGI